MYFSATAFNNDCITAQKNAQHGNKAARMSYSVSALTKTFGKLCSNLLRGRDGHRTMYVVSNCDDVADQSEDYFVTEHFFLIAAAIFAVRRRFLILMKQNFAKRLGYWKTEMRDLNVTILAKNRNIHVLLNQK